MLITDSENFYLNCPYEQKDEAKALGARWDAGKRKWYVPPGIDRNMFRKWFPSDIRSPSKSVDVSNGSFKFEADFTPERLALSPEKMKLEDMAKRGKFRFEGNSFSNKADMSPVKFRLEEEFTADQVDISHGKFSLGAGLTADRANLSANKKQDNTEDEDADEEEEEDDDGDDFIVDDEDDDDDDDSRNDDASDAENGDTNGNHDNREASDSEETVELNLSERFYLNCPYEQKDEAKAMGARWDAGKRKWYVPPGIDRNLFRKWFPSDPIEDLSLGKRKFDYDAEDYFESCCYEGFEEWKANYIAKNAHMKGYCWEFVNGGHCTWLDNGIPCEYKHSIPPNVRRRKFPAK